jgi:hypothetical protein
MRKGIVIALTVTGSLLLGPTALAAPVTPQHAGHDHGKKPDKPKPKPKKPDKGHKGKKQAGGHSDSAHASGGYDSNRGHPRNW